MSKSTEKNTKSLFKIGIIGFGTVGRAVVQGFEFLADIKIYDKFYPVDGFETVVNESEFIFICVPTPEGKDGKIDLSAINRAIDKIAKLKSSRGKIVIIKSTVVPGTTSFYQDKYPHLNIVVNPEFLTARTHLLDFINSSRVILGGEKDVCKKLEKLYRARMGHVPIFITTPETAELVKYTSNCFFATKIGFFNEICLLCTKLGVDYGEVKKMVLADGRIGNSHMDVPGHDGKFGWGGACFLKDTKAFYQKAKEMGVDLKILRAAIKSNKAIRNLD